MSKGNGNNNLRVYLNSGNIKGTILSRARNKKEIIYGARSIQKQIGLGARPTEDYDIFTKDSKIASGMVEKRLDKLTRGNNFYVKKGVNPGTWKVKSMGIDRIKGNDDDKTIVDYTIIPKPKPKFRMISGIRYRTLAEEKKAKLRILKDPRFKFRMEKDLNDLRRINRAKKLFRKG